MKKPNLAALILAVAFAGGAHATGEKQSPRPVTPAPAKQAQSQAQDQTQQTNAAATSQASAAGGASSVGVVAPAQTVGGDSNDARAWSLVLPPLAFTPPMAAIAGCAPEVTQSARGVLFGAYSEAAGKTDPQDCTLIALRNAKVEQCQYASAKQIEDLMLAKKLPDFKPSQVAFADYTPQDCAAIKAPPKPAPIVNYAYAPADECPTKPAKPAKRAAKPAVDLCKTRNTP